jgi:hypothetical protein
MLANWAKLKEGNSQAAKQGWRAHFTLARPQFASTLNLKLANQAGPRAKSAETIPSPSTGMPSFSSTSFVSSSPISTSSPSHSLPARRVSTALSSTSTSAKTMSSQEANLASPQVPVPVPVPPVPVLPAPEHHHPHLEPLPLDHHRDSLKRPRSDSSDDDGSPEPQGYPAPPGARYGKDSLICDQCGVAFRKHSDLK